MGSSPQATRSVYARPNCAGGGASPSGASLSASSSVSSSQVFQRVDHLNSLGVGFEERFGVADRPNSLGINLPRARWCALCFLIVMLSIPLLRQIPLKSLLLDLLQRQRANCFWYILCYALAGLVVPAPFLSVLGGVLFGASLKATAAIYAGSFLAALLSFAASRLLLRRQVKRLLIRRVEKLHALDEALAEDSLVLTLCARFVTPFTVCNYFLGVTPISVRTFCIATLLSCLPFAFVYALIGGELGSLEAAAQAETFRFSSERVDLFGFFSVEVRYLRWGAAATALLVFGATTQALRKLAQRFLEKAQERRPLHQQQ